MRISATASAIGLAFLAGCSGRNVAPPPMATDTAPSPRETSIIAVPVDADRRLLTRLLERRVPRALWSINRHLDECVAPRRVKLFGKRIKVTPAIGCTIVGEVTRGAIVLRGQGREIIADIPIRARIGARDIGGILKGKTATGAAMVHAHVRLDITPDWKLTGTVRLAHDWTTPPGVTILGRRVTFTDRADEKLEPVRRQLEEALPRELSEVNLRPRIEGAWRKSFVSLPLNARDPSVWMRITPRRLIYDGYALRGERLRLDLALEAVTETFVGARPGDPPATPLPPLEKARVEPGLRFFSPVVADYAELEPVILRALVKRSRRAFDLPRLGPVVARFERVRIYGTTGGRVAVGLALAARRASGSGDETHGLLWLTAKPVNAPGSPRIAFSDLKVTGATDGLAGNLLIQLAGNPNVTSQIADALTQNFTTDLENLLRKIRLAVDTLQKGDFTISGTVEKYGIGGIEAHGDGLYLPVRMTGSARISYHPPAGAGTSPRATSRRPSIRA